MYTRDSELRLGLMSVQAVLAENEEKITENLNAMNRIR